MGAPKKKSPARESSTLEDDPKVASTRPDEMPPEVLEFITAIDEYKRLHGRPFPTWSEVLEVVKTLGYSRASHGR